MSLKNAVLLVPAVIIELNRKREGEREGLKALIFVVLA
jgi:hypothetical protein